MRIDSRERRSSLTPFILLPAHFSSRPHPSSLRGEGLNFFGFAEKVLYAPQLPRRSSSRVGAVRRDEREGEERGKSEPFSFSKTQHFTFVVKPHPKVLKICLVFKRNHEDIEFSIKMKMVKGANHLVHRMEGPTKNPFSIKNAFHPSRRLRFQRINAYSDK